MPFRTFDVSQVWRTMKPYERELVGFRPKDWLSDPENVCLTDGKGSFALFQRDLPWLVTGHYFFTLRGKEARDFARDCLRELFTGGYRVEAIRGLTPLDKKGALWMNRQLGFTEHELVETEVGPCALVTLTKTEWEQLNG